MKIEIIKSNNRVKWQKEEYLPASFTNPITIKLDLNKQDQKIFGFGGAFTDAAEITYHSLSKDKQKEYLEAYFGKEGLNYNLGRYPIMSTDFSTYSYEYLSDDNLDHFSLDSDKNRIEMLKDVLKIKPDLWLIGSPWSPSTFMKTNGNRCFGGKLKAKYYSLWADVLLKTVNELSKEGIKLSCLTTQNEPLATQTWESCLYSSDEEANFLKNHLIPKAKQYGMHDLKFMIYDHNRDKMFERANEVFSIIDQKEIFGVAYHWYDRNYFEGVKQTHQKYPNQHLLLTEACVELLMDDNNGIGSWENGMRYAFNIINDLNNGSEGYIDWNLSLNLKGGPNHVGNFCEAPLLIDEKNNKIKYMPSYFCIGHFSKYLNKGDIRIETTSSSLDVLACSFIDVSKIKMVVLNTSKENKDVSIILSNEQNVSLSLESQSLYTLIIDN